ncbi:MAG: transposase [Holdemanella porci]
MIATLHTFGRDLKWNPHIHCLIPELIYSLKKTKSKHFIISISLSLEKHFNLN